MRFAWPVVVIVLALAGCRGGSGGSGVPVIRTVQQYDQVRVQAWDLAKNGLQAFEEGVPPGGTTEQDLKRAAELYRGMVDFAPASYGAHYGLAKIATALGDPDEALRHFEQALTLALRDERPAAQDVAAECHDGIARIVVLRGDAARAEAEARLALQHRPEQPNYMATLASALVQSGQIDEAKELVKRALEAEPRNRRALALAAFLESDR